MKLDLTNLEIGKKFLLGFSGGTDSSALLHYLSHHQVQFDIAIVNYNLRDEAKSETENAIQLSNILGIKCHTLSTELSTIGSLEANARTVRHDFFTSLINEYHYDGLILGHNLNDKMEWFLMQLTKGAGLSELLGMTNKDFRTDGGYFIFRPLIMTPKDDILLYLQTHSISFSLDLSNEDDSFSPKNNIGIKRNYFRHHFSNKLCSEFKSGIQKSFLILDQEKSNSIDYIVKSPHPDVFIISHLDLISEMNKNTIIRACDFVFKHHFNKLLTGGMRSEILKNIDRGVCISGSICIGRLGNNILITPKIDHTPMDKKSKDAFRTQKIPKLSRDFLYKNKFSLFPL